MSVFSEAMVLAIKQGNKHNLRALLGMYDRQKLCKLSGCKGWYLLSGHRCCG